MKIRTVGAKFFNADRQTDGHDGINNFHKFASALKNRAPLFSLETFVMPSDRRVVPLLHHLCIEIDPVRKVYSVSKTFTAW
jgi:hypothetical protein